MNTEPNSDTNDSDPTALHPGGAASNGLNPSIRSSTGPSPHHSTTPPLHLFTQPEILRQIGPLRLDKFLTGFVDCLEKPLPPLPAPEDERYLDSLAAAFTNHSLLPDRLRHALFILENAVSRENRHLLDSTIQRRI